MRAAGYPFEGQTQILGKLTGSKTLWDDSDLLASIASDDADHARRPCARPATPSHATKSSR